MLTSHGVRLQDPAQIAIARRELTVAPLQTGGVSCLPKPFGVFRACEGDGGGLYVPRHYAESKFGVSPVDRRPDPSPAPGLARFVGALKADLRQPEAAAATLGALRDRGATLLCLPTGYGKCLGLGTPVLLYDGTVRAVETIEAGEVLMGDDSGPRVVATLARGVEDMYRIVPRDGTRPYEVNASHILCLRGRDGDVRHISVLEYLELSAHERGFLKAYRTAIDFDTSSASVGGSGTPPPDIASALALAASHPERLPHSHLTASRQVRSALLLALVSGFQIGRAEPVTRIGVAGETCLTRSLDLAEDMCFLARSLGFVSSVDPSPLLVNGVQSMYSRVSVRKSRHLDYGFRVESLGLGQYYGFSLAGGANRRFVLGDFSVTHNTTTALHVASSLGLKTLVLVHKTFLGDQWRERVGQHLPDARVSKIQGPVADTSGDVVIATIQTLTTRAFPPGFFDAFGTLIVDECHHLGASVFSSAMFSLCFKHVLGLSATPQRRDGLSRILDWFFGGMAFSLERSGERRVVVRTVPYDCARYSDPLPQNRRGDLDYVALMTVLVSDAARTEAVASAVAAVMEAEPARHVLVLSHRRQHCAELTRVLQEKGLDCAMYVGGKGRVAVPAPDTRVLVATYSLVNEGFDRPQLDTLVLATPASDVVQACGRILRGSAVPGGPTSPLILDVVDKVSVCYAQHAKRKRQYAKAGFTIVAARTKRPLSPSPAGFMGIDSDSE